MLYDKVKSMSFRGIGVDVCEVDRLRRIIDTYQERFLNRIFTTVEIQYCRPKADRIESLAARFAAKEALFKAMGTGLRNGMTWTDIEVVNDPLGKPEFRFYGRASELIGNDRAMLSLSHTRQNAIAFVIITGGVQA